MNQDQVHAIVRKDKTSIAKEPKILFWDTETSPLLGWAWQAYETDLLRIEEDVKIISIAWKWQHEKKTHVMALPDFSGYKKGKINDYQIVRKIWELMDEADIVIAQNGDKFDTRVAQARMLAHKMNPPSPFLSIDTLKVARKYFNLPMYKLDEILRYVDLKRKISTGGKELWFKCMEGDMSAWAKMKEYNRNDVEIMPPLYERMRGWHKTHPSITQFTRRDHACPVCNSNNIQKRGEKNNTSGYYQSYSCNNCGKWSKGPTIREDITKITIK